MFTQLITSVELFNSKWFRDGRELPVAISRDSVSIADTIPAIL
jgi:hypothetical protein